MYEAERGSGAVISTVGRTSRCFVLHSMQNRFLRKTYKRVIAQRLGVCFAKVAALMGTDLAWNACSVRSNRTRRTKDAVVTS